MSKITRRKFTRGTIMAAGSIAAGELGLLTAASGKVDKAWVGKRPNILLLFSDQHNASILGCEGHPDIKTPNFDRMAKGGVRFSRAYCQDGVCVPSRTSFMTGLYPRTLGVLHNSDRSSVLKRVLPLASLLKRNGYRTAAFGKRHLPIAPYTCDSGWDIHYSSKDKESPADNYVKWVGRQGYAKEFAKDWAAEFGRGPEGSIEYENKYPIADLAARISALPADKTMEAYTAMKTIKFLKDQKNRNKPFFCWASFYRPHQPYNAQKKYLDLYDLSKGGIKMPGNFLEPEENLPPLMREWRGRPRGVWCLGKAAKNHQIYRNYIGAYYALVSEIDHHVGQILETLKKEGLADNTIVLYMADHGDFVGAHGMVEKCAVGHNVYEDTLRVPLIIYWPGRFKKGLVCDDLVELVDIFPTLLELTGISYPKNEFSLVGRSLVPTLKKGAPIDRKYIVSENWSQMTVIGKRYKLGVMVDPMIYKNLDWRDHGDMLFDRKKDHLEVNNLVGKPEVRAAEKEMREYLEKWKNRIPDTGKRELTSEYRKILNKQLDEETININKDERITLIGPWEDKLWIVPTRKARAIWTSKIKTSGRYHVEVWYGDDPNDDHAANAGFTVIHANGKKQFTVNLKKKVETWNRLGTFKFKEGWTGKVELNASKANGNLITFKARFIKAN